MILKTKQMTIIYPQWDRWTSYDVIKQHMITTLMLYQNSFKGNEESALLSTGQPVSLQLLSLSVSLSIIFSLKSLLPWSKQKSLQRMERSCNIRSVLGSSLAYYCQSSTFSQLDLKCLNVHKFGLQNGVWSYHNRQHCSHHIYTCKQIPRVTSQATYP